MLKRLAQVSYRRRWRVLAAWLVLLIGSFYLSGVVGGAFKTSFTLSGSESQEAIDLLERSGFSTRAGQQGRIVFEAQSGVDDPAVRDTMVDLFDRVEDEISHVEVVSPYTDEGQIKEGTQQVSTRIGTANRIAYAELNFDDVAEELLRDLADEVEALASDVNEPGVSIELGGQMFQEDFTSGTSETVSLLAAIVILLVAFGSVIAMGLPLLNAIFGVGTGIALMLMARSVIDIPDFTTAGVAMVGIGVGIDYALLIVTRYREGLHSGLEPEAAVVHSIDTAGRAVLFAGVTVMISILGLFTMGQAATQAMALAIALGVLMTMLASVTLIPALLGFAGHNLDRLGLPHRKRGAGRSTTWFRWSRLLQRRPWPPLLVGLIVLLALAAPLLSMRLGTSDEGNLPTTDTSRRAYDLLSDGFGPGFNGPLLLAAATPGRSSDVDVLDQLRRVISDDKNVEFVTPVLSNGAGDAAIMQVFPRTSPQDEGTGDLVNRLRDDVVPSVVGGTDVEVNVGGITAATEDFAADTTKRLPLFIGVVLLLSFLLLMVVFRSLLVPLKAVVMNLLSIGAAYGVVVAIFQWGWAADLLGFGKAGPIDSWAPAFMFAIVFGLSMDYEVFLLSRIREEYVRTGDNALAVADGLAVTARVITAAAAIMVCVSGSFALSNLRSVQLFGLGLAVAIFLDATIVRLILVPATMELLGDRNWWLPKWLDRILPEVHVEGPSVDDELAALGEHDRPARV